jgi:thymidylate kinase
MVLAIEQRQWGAVKPAVAFLFERQIPNRRIQPQERVRLQALYAQLARRERHRHPVEVVDNNRAINDAVAQVISSTFERISTCK